MMQVLRDNLAVNCTVSVGHTCSCSHNRLLRHQLDERMGRREEEGSVAEGETPGATAQPRFSGPQFETTVPGCSFQE
jgi:hypothetical protein